MEKLQKMQKLKPGFAINFLPVLIKQHHFSLYSKKQCRKKKQSRKVLQKKQKAQTEHKQKLSRSCHQTWLD